MKKRIFILPVALVLAVVLVTFTGCEDDKPGTTPLQTVNVDVYETIDYGAKYIFLHFETDLKTYPVTYSIRNGVKSNGNSFEINLPDIENSNYNDQSIKKGSATADVGLGTLANGVYDITIKVAQNINTGTLTVGDSLMVLDFPSLQALTVNHDMVRRIPFGTMWGYISYKDVADTAITTAVLDSMTSIGVLPASYPTGYYGYFSIDDTGAFIQNIPAEIEYYEPIFHRYNGAVKTLDELITFYKINYYNDIDIVVYYFYGSAAKSGAIIPGRQGDGLREELLFFKSQN
ncbi:MAG TPA: hypothetical protein VFC92_07065 [Bacteroidales bacterium]|nr:hypothetical protein [Bacteroidales bacterium]